MTDSNVPEGAEKGAEQPAPEDMLLDESADVAEASYDPPLTDTTRRWGSSEWETAHDEPLDRRLAQEVPEDAREGARDESLAGRLVADDGGMPERENDVYATAAGIDGGAPTEEELAVHVVSEDDLDADDARTADDPVVDADDDAALDGRDEGA